MYHSNSMNAILWREQKNLNQRPSSLLVYWYLVPIQKHYNITSFSEYLTRTTYATFMVKPQKHSIKRILSLIISFFASSINIIGFNDESHGRLPSAKTTPYNVVATDTASREFAEESLEVVGSQQLLHHILTSHQVHLFATLFLFIIFILFLFWLFFICILFLFFCFYYLTHYVLERRIFHADHAWR